MLLWENHHASNIQSTLMPVVVSQKRHPEYSVDVHFRPTVRRAKSVFSGARTATGAHYYNYKLVGRTQYYYWFQILKRGTQEEWVITNISFTDNPL